MKSCFDSRWVGVISILCACGEDPGLSPVPEAAPLLGSVSLVGFGGGDDLPEGACVRAQLRRSGMPNGNGRILRDGTTSIAAHGFRVTWSDLTEEELEGGTFFLVAPYFIDRDGDGVCSPGDCSYRIRQIWNKRPDWRHIQRFTELSWEMGQRIVCITDDASFCRDFSETDVPGACE